MGKNEPTTAVNEMWDLVVDKNSKFFTKENGLYQQINLDKSIIGLFEKNHSLVYENSERFKKFFDSKRRIFGIWYPVKYNNAVKDIGELIKTPFMLEIIIDSLPKLEESVISENSIKKQFLERCENSGFSFQQEWKRMKKMIQKAMASVERQKFHHIKNPQEMPITPAQPQGGSDTKDTEKIEPESQEQSSNIFTMTYEEYREISSELLRNIKLQLDCCEEQNKEKLFYIIKKILTPKKIIRFD
jgi:hypothetical protein